MSCKRPNIGYELPADYIKIALGGSPNSKMSSNDYKIRVKDSNPRKIRVVPKKSSHRDLRFTSAMETYNKPKELISEKHKKRSEYKLLYNNLAESSQNGVEKLLDKEKYLKSKDSKISKFYEKIDKKLETIQKFSSSDVANDYFEIFEEIIKRDVLFGGYLKKIKSGLKNWYDKNEGLLEYCTSLEKKLEEKQSLINKHFISNRNNISKSAEPQEFIHLNNTISFNIPTYKLVPLDEYNKENIENLKITINELEIINNKYLQKIEELENCQKISEEKETKYSLLLKALNDRGYPINEIYSKDVLFNHTLNPPKQLISEDLIFLSSDESQILSP
jgi:hypothetical protein